MLNEILCQIGLTKNESRIYLVLLQVGPQAVSVIARQAKLNRTTTYSVLKSLEKKGIVSTYKNESVQFFVSNDPNTLIGYLDRQCATFDYYKGELLRQVPKLRDMAGEYITKKPVVSFYDGIEGVKHVMYEALGARGEFRVYLPLHKWFSSGLKEFLLEYKDSRITNKKVPLKVITPDTPEVRAFFDNNYKKGDKLTTIFYVSHESYPDLFEHEINIYDDKVAIIHLDKGSEYSVVIESKEIALMHRAIFDMAWKGCSGEVVEI